MKVVTIVLGILILIGGIYCLITPIATYAALSWLIGAVMVIEGVASIVTWNDRRKLGYADGWTLAGAIVSLILGIFLLGSYVAQFAVDLFIAYMIAAWLVVGGVTRIMAAFRMRDYDRYAGSAGGSDWGMLLAMGIFVTILGVLCLFNPTSVMVGVGFMLGISIVCVGIGIIVRGVRM